MPKVEFLIEQKTIEVGKYANLREAALKAGLDVYVGINRLANCHGWGLCGTCTMKVVEGMDHLSPRTIQERIGLKGADPDLRLSCQCEVLGNVCVVTNYNARPKRQ